MTNLLYLGHGSFRLTTPSAVIYIDPFASGDYSVPADFVLVTHEHYDHNRVDLVTLNNSGKILRAADFFDGKNYMTMTFGELTVTAVPAYNKNHKTGCVGFVIETDGLKLYFAGDTSTTEYMSRLKGIDYAFLPTDGIYNMNAAEASKCAKIIGARFAVPVHTERPEENYNRGVAAKFDPPNKLIVLPGSEITL